MKSSKVPQGLVTQHKLPYQPGAPIQLGTGTIVEAGADSTERTSHICGDEEMKTTLRCCRSVSPPQRFTRLPKPSCSRELQAARRAPKAEQRCRARTGRAHHTAMAKHEIALTTTPVPHNGRFSDFPPAKVRLTHNSASPKFRRRPLFRWSG